LTDERHFSISDGGVFFFSRTSPHLLPSRLKHAFFLPETLGGGQANATTAVVFSTFSLLVSSLFGGGALFTYHHLG